MDDTEDIKEYVKNDAEEKGYYLCPDDVLYDDLIQGLEKNLKRYGYPSCPCREASGIKTYDSDIICPCEYRDADVKEYGMCYCGLFVSEDLTEEPEKMGPIPERRSSEATEAAMKAKEMKDVEREVDTEWKDEELKVWRCSVCGYLAARENPPPVCPICQANAERFKVFEYLKS